MAITIQEINELRKKTQAGLMDCKKALTEANGDMEAAMEILRKKGQLVAAKRSDRDAAEGCVLAKVEGNYGAMIALTHYADIWLVENRLGLTGWGEILAKLGICILLPNALTAICFCRMKEYSELFGALNHIIFKKSALPQQANTAE